MWRTAEFVSPKHPDKICDRISDKVLDYCIGLDPNARVAIETMGGHGSIYVNGEITMKSTTTIPVPHLVEEVLETTDYLQSTQVNIVQQSPEISRGVDTGGAGDQGIMVGYACDENDEYVPEEYRLSRSLCRHLYDKFPYDGKTQVTTRDDRNIFVVTSFQNVDRVTLHNEVSEWLKTEDYGLMLTHANPAGDWTQGGFDADAGVTGRKLVVDNYGPRVPIGGGAFSGKDSSKVDRSAAYMARRIAVDLLEANDGAEEVYVYLAYAIGYDKPLQATAIIDGYEVGVEPRYDLSPNGIVSTLGLQEPKFEKTAEWGHMGTEQIWG